MLESLFFNLNIFPHQYLIFLKGFLGFVTVFIITCSLNFFIPINYIVVSLLVVLGSAFFLYFHKRIFSNIRQVLSILFSSLIVFTMVIIFRQILGDTGFYHIQSVKWIIAQKIPLGLANLYPQLGFNTSWFYIESYIDQFLFYTNLALFSSNAVLLILFLSIIISILLDIILNLKGKKISNYEKLLTVFSKLSSHEIFIIFGATLPIVKVSRDHLSSLSYDFPVFIFIIVIFSLLIFIIKIEKKEINNMNNINNINNIFILLAIFTLSLKLSAIIIVIMVLVIFLLFNFHNYFTRYNCLSRIEKLAFIIKSCKYWFYLSGIVLTPILIRGFLLAGNPIFPIPVPNIFNISWSVPFDQQIITAKEVTAYARLPFADRQTYMDSLNNWNWIVPWLKKFLSWEILLILLITIGLFIILLFFIYSIKNPKLLISPNEYSISPKFLFIFICIGLIFWFFAGPETRFGLGFLYSLPLFLITYPYIRFRTPYPEIFQKILIYLFFSLILCSIGYSLYSINSIDYLKVIQIPEVDYVEEKTINGLSVYIPTSSPYMNYFIPWNGPLPSTPYLNNNLSITKNGEIFTKFEIIR